MNVLLAITFGILWHFAESFYRMAFLILVGTSIANLFGRKLLAFAQFCMDLLAILFWASNFGPQTITNFGGGPIGLICLGSAFILILIVDLLHPEHVLLAAILVTGLTLIGCWTSTNSIPAFCYFMIIFVSISTACGTILGVFFLRIVAPLIKNEHKW